MQYTEKRKPNISYQQGVRNVRFSDVFKGIKRENWKEKD